VYGTFGRTGFDFIGTNRCGAGRWDPAGCGVLRVTNRPAPIQVVMG